MTIDPRVRLLDTVNKSVNVWLVNGKFVRNHIDINFTNGGNPCSESYIPSNEIWIDREAPGADEHKFWVLRQVTERLLGKQGYTPKNADLYAKRIEEHERNFGVGSKNPKIEILKEKDGTKIWLVSGKTIRNVYDVDFSLGGHGYVYHYIPFNEVWIDDALEDSERMPVIKHEMEESKLMKNGVPYEEAHNRANVVELAYRSSM